MRVGFVGAGTLTKTFGRHLINAGHCDCRIQFREAGDVAGLVADLAQAQRLVREQALKSDIVILATNWVNVPEALKDIDWPWRILIDATNAHMIPNRCESQRRE